MRNCELSGSIVADFAFEVLLTLLGEADMLSCLKELLLLRELYRKTFELHMV